VALDSSAADDIVVVPVPYFAVVLEIDTVSLVGIVIAVEVAFSVSAVVPATVVKFNCTEVYVSSGMETF